MKERIIRAFKENPVFAVWKLLMLPLVVTFIFITAIALSLYNLDAKEGVRFINAFI